MKRLLSIASVVAAMLVSTSAFAESDRPKLEGKWEWMGARHRVMVYRPVQEAKPFALTGESRAVETRKMKLVPQFQDIGARTRVMVYKWVPAE